MAATSVSRRLLLSVAVPLLLFFGISIAVLDHQFRKVADDALRRQLDTELVALIASSDPDEAGAIAPLLKSAESRLVTPGSGLYARVVNRRGLQVWRSPSNAGVEIDFGPPLQPGKTTYREFTGAGDVTFAALSRGLRWEDRGRRLDLTFTVVMSLAAHDAQLNAFRGVLFGGFAVIALGLLVTLGILLRWALRPLRVLSAQISEVESGERERLDSRWPRELRGVVFNLNALLDAERHRIARYRDTLGNLAHSLKTPLAVIRSSLDGRDPGAIGAAVDEQVGRMTAIVEHQLKRAVGGGLAVGQRPIPVAPVAQDLRVALLKAHAGKDFSLEVAVDASAQFVGDKDDLYEALGNLMQNAAKWCATRVRVSGLMRELVDGSRRLEILVEDDGPGIPVAERERVLQRGARADEIVPGHGLGLAMVRDMAQQYGGEILLGESPLGGAKLTLLLPSR